MTVGALNKNNKEQGFTSYLLDNELVPLLELLLIDALSSSSDGSAHVKL